MNLEPLDIMACYGTGRTSRVIRWGTASPLAPRRLRLGPSHVAVICEHNSGPLWVESTTLCRHRCAIIGLHARGVQAHLPEQRIEDYVGTDGRVDVYRLSPIDSLSTSETDLLHRILISHFVGSGVTYDTGGALISGTRVIKWSRLLAANLESVFCSELVAAVLMRLGRLNRANPTRYNPSSLLRQLVREGTYQFAESYS